MGLKLAGIMVIVMLVFGGIGAWYYKTSQNTISTLTSNVATLKADKKTLENEIDRQNDTINKLEDQRQSDQETILSLRESERESRAKVDELRGVFARHDFGRLSAAKPGLLERIVNRGTAEVGSEIETLTNPDREEIPDPNTSASKEASE